MYHVYTKPYTGVSSSVSIRKIFLQSMFLLQLPCVDLEFVCWGLTAVVFTHSIVPPNVVEDPQQQGAGLK